MVCEKEVRWLDYKRGQEPLLPQIPANKVFIARESNQRFNGVNTLAVSRTCLLSSPTITVSGYKPLSAVLYSLLVSFPAAIRAE